MSVPEPTYGDYLKAAFNLSPRVPGFGNLPLNWLGIATFGTLGLLNPGFWLLGAGLELAFLATLSNNRRFQNTVRGQRLAAAAAARAHAAGDAEQARVDALPDEDQHRYAALRARMAAAPVGTGGTAALVADVARDGLDALGATFLDLLEARARLLPRADARLRREVRAELDAETRALEGLGADGDPRIRRSVEGTVAILNRRLDKLDAAARDVAYLDSELRRIEHQVALVLDEAALADDPAALTRRIDQVTATFDETREWMRMHRELLEDLDPDDGPSPGARAAHAQRAGG